VAVTGQPRVVVLRALKLGDFLTAVPALRALRCAHPEHRLVLAAPAAIESLAMLSGAVDEVIDTAPLASLDRRLDGADVAVNLHGKGPSSTRRLAETRPARLIAFRHPRVPATEGQPEWRDDEHEVALWCRLLEENGIPADAGDLLLERPDVAVPDGAPGATVIHPGASAAARRWPLDRWAEVARAERRAGRDVLVTGGPDEVRIARKLAAMARLPERTVIAGTTGLVELAAIVAVAGRVASADTGIAHLASAYRTPSVVLFGPTSPSRWGPPAGGPHAVIWKGSVGDANADTVDPGLLEIDVREVIDALAQLTAASQPV
jgi:ADP-heptose:LPS heptosyltransferase